MTWCSVHSALVFCVYTCHNTMVLYTQCTSIMQLVICAMTWCCSVHIALILCIYMCHDTMMISTQRASIMQFVIYSCGSMEVLFGPPCCAVCFLNSSSGMQISSRTWLWTPSRRWRSQMARVVFYTQWKRWTFWKLMAVVPERVYL